MEIRNLVADYVQRNGLLYSDIADVNIEAEKIRKRHRFTELNEVKYTADALGCSVFLYKGCVSKQNLETFISDGKDRNKILRVLFTGPIRNGHF